jgi:hypothetical protein
MRHTVTWLQPRTDKTFVEAFHILETDGVLFRY